MTRSHSVVSVMMAAMLAVSVGATVNPTANVTPEGFVSLKLTPRHVELDRRRRERRLAEEEVEDDSDFTAEEQYRRREDAVQVGALFEGYGTHYIDLWCGSPPQRQTVIVDTGSGVTAFPCSGCKNCGVPDYHVDRLFVEEESSTFQESTCTSNQDCIMSRSNCKSGSCNIGMSYAEGSRWNAYEAVDKCYVGGPHEIPLVAKTPTLEGDDMDPLHAADFAFDMTFGCQTLVTGLFKTQLADGIMGMSNQASTFWSQMFKADKMGPNQRFSLCFSRPPDILKEGTEAGAMTLGGCDQRLHKTPMVFTPNFDTGRSSFFSVKVRRMMLRDGKYGQSVQSTAKNPNMGVKVLDLDEAVINNGGIIVDSGTTDTYWSMGVAPQFNKIFKEMAGWQHHNNGLSLTEEEVAALPTILLQLYGDEDRNSAEMDLYKTPGLAGALDPKHPSDVILAIPPSHYMEYNPDKELYTSRFYPTERRGSVLGANSMMGHDVFFDIDTKNIGWAESDCDYTQTVKDNGYDFEITGHLKNKVTQVNDKNRGNKHSSNANDEKPTCESISSGNQCQKTEGCTWGWGKCKTSESDSASAATQEPTSTYSVSSSETTTDFGSSMRDDIDNPNIINVDALVDTAKGHQMELAIGLGVTLLLVCCCCFLCCRTRTSTTRTKGRYAKAANLEPTSIEMMTTNGGGSSVDGFKDEPDAAGGLGGEGGGGSSLGGSSFKDHPDEPEFEGDFA